MVNPNDRARALMGEIALDISDMLRLDEERRAHWEACRSALEAGDLLAACIAQRESARVVYTTNQRAERTATMFRSLEAIDPMLYVDVRSAIDKAVAANPSLAIDENGASPNRGPRPEATRSMGKRVQQLSDHELGIAILSHGMSCANPRCEVNVELDAEMRRRGGPGFIER